MIYGLPKALTTNNTFTLRTTSYIGLILFVFIQACGNTSSHHDIKSDNKSVEDNNELSKEKEIINPDGQVLITRILPPEGFQRTESTENSFAYYLRHLPLKPHNSEVNLYNGTGKPNNGIYDAVVDLDIGTKDLHQCADAIMRLRAEYLWNNKQYDKIHFNFTNGFRCDYTEWMKGKRIVLNGNSTYWKQTADSSNTYTDFWNYMEIIFIYAGTLSLSEELKLTGIDEMQIGNIYIQGGSPGHAVIIVDMAVNNTTNKKVFLLAQSYMPAQEIHILKNPNDETISPWYSTEFLEKLVTPEWIFRKTDLKRFEE